VLHYPSYYGAIIIGTFAIIIFICYFLVGRKAGATKEVLKKESQPDLTAKNSEKETELSQWDSTELAGCQKFQAEGIEPNEIRPAPKLSVILSDDNIKRAFKDVLATADNKQTAALAADLMAKEALPLAANKLEEDFIQTTDEQNTRQFSESTLTNAFAASDELEIPVFVRVKNTVSQNTDLPQPDLPQPFGYKMAWLAVRSNNTKKVLEKLALKEQKPANWSQGLTAAYENQGFVFVSPPLKGWVLIVGRALWDKFDLAQPPQRLFLLRGLSQAFGHAQYFSTIRGVETHAWAMAEDGQIMRAYAYSGEIGEVLWDFGELTNEEEELGFAFFDPESIEAEEENYWQRSDLRYPDERDVIALAAVWGMDTRFDGRQWQPGIGAIGRL